jgi:hypothetical protein
MCSQVVRINGAYKVLGQKTTRLGERKGYIK